MFKPFCFLLTGVVLLAYGSSEGNALRDATELSRLNSSLAWSDAPSWDVRGHAAQRISPYDYLIREESRREGHDWRLLAAIAYAESRFTPGLRSARGAVGLMQVMPVVARQFDVDESQIADLRTNVRLAAMLLTQIGKSLVIPSSAAEEDRCRITLACYNGGIGHVLDARNLARKYGSDPNSWAGVSNFLARKAEPEYSGDETVKCGNFGGSAETIAFVDTVMKTYTRYKTMVSL